MNEETVAETRADKQVNQDIVVVTTRCPQIARGWGGDICFHPIAPWEYGYGNG